MTLSRVAIVAGEESGDILGAGLMHELRVLNPKIEFVGMGGERMIAQGLESQFPIDRLAVMGLMEPLKRLPELLKIRSKLAKNFVDTKAELFIGIDSPDFNLGLAKKLKKKGLKTVQYVSPSVWAWRQGRVSSIQKNIDLMLTLLPFEARFYQNHQVPVRYVGHPLATEIKADDPTEARQRLGIPLPASERLLTLLPGSRSAEIKHLVPVYLDAVKKIHEIEPGLKIIFAAPNQKKAEQIRSFFGDKKFEVVVGKTLDAITAATLVLAASGTTTLEVMLVNRPLIVAYKTDWLSYKIIGPMVKVPYVSLPNLIAAKPLVNEYIQDAATAENLSEAVLSILTNSEISKEQCEVFAELRRELELPSSLIAAESITNLIAALH